MANDLMRHKHVRINHLKLKKARKTLRTDTDTDTLDRALDLVVAQGEIESTLKRVRGKGRLVKVFR